MGNKPSTDRDPKARFRTFPGSAFLEKTFCGSIDTTDPAEYDGETIANRLLRRADAICVSSPKEYVDSPGPDRPIHPSSALLARALVNEVTGNPKTMKPAEMAEREYKLLRAQEAATKANGNSKSRPVGAPGGVGPPNVLSSFAFACTGDDSLFATNVMAPGPLQEHRALNIAAQEFLDTPALSPYAVTIGLSMSRRHNSGHPESITRQTAYDFNELQDRQYKYVSSTDKYGWRAGGGEKGGPTPVTSSSTSEKGAWDETAAGDNVFGGLQSAQRKTPSPIPSSGIKEASPDTVHIPIIHIDCPNADAVDQVIHALASGDIFIPHMAVQPESLSVNGISLPDLVVRFGCERNDDLPPDDWPNWALEFMHNQLYEYFYNLGARWMKRPFNITLARKVRWKTVKHMNRYFGHAERVVETWREKGPQYLDPQLSYIEGGATPDEVARPHGVYLMRNGVPTNYFAPNFEPPYTTKMTRSLLQNVLDKSWDRKRRDWSSDPIPKIVTPTMLMAVACGCADPSAGGFMANEVTKSSRRTSALPDERLVDDQNELIITGKDMAEEKKVDEIEIRDKEPPRDAPRHPRTIRQNSHSSQRTEDGDVAHSVAASGYSMSVAASGTTVLHNNSALGSLPRQRQDDWSYQSKDSSNGSDPPGNKGFSPHWSKKKKAAPMSGSDPEKYSHYATAKSQTALGAAQARMDREKARSGHIRRRSESPNVEESAESALSLQYSTDGSSAVLTADGSSLLGGQYTGDGSSSVGAPGRELSSDPSHREDEDLANVSVQESSSSIFSAIPTDEELFAIGWAKALDPNSGNYYYFTLDRSKTVWENPLSQTVSLGGFCSER